MKLNFNTHQEYLRLAQYFSKIEAMAYKMGIDVDDLVKDEEFKQSEIYRTYKKSFLTIAQKRIEALNQESPIDSGKNSSGFNVLQFCNEDY